MNIDLHEKENVVVNPIQPNIGYKNVDQYSFMWKYV